MAAAIGQAGGDTEAVLTWTVRRLPVRFARRYTQCRTLLWFGAVCLLLIAVVAAGVPVYVRPQADALGRADAVFVLGGEGYERYPLGLELVANGWAPVVVFSNPNGPNDAWLTHFCAEPHPIDLECFIPEPRTTRGEARELRRFAEKYGWRTVIVVTFTPHISRARYILERCFSGDLIMVPSRTHLSFPMWAREYAYQTAGYVRAMLQPGC